MTRAGLLGLGCCFVSALLPCSPAFAQASLRVVRTLGDASETTCIALDGEELWVGTLGSGVHRIRNAGTIRYDSAAGLAGNRVRDCAIADGVVWVATDAGLSRFSEEKRGFSTVARGRFLKVAAGARVLLAARADGTLLRFERGASHPPLATGTVASALAISADGTRLALGGIDGRLHVGTSAKLRELELPGATGARPEPIELLTFASDRLHVSTSTRQWQIDATGRATATSARVLPAVQTDGAAGTAVALSPQDQGMLRSALVRTRVRWHGHEVIATDAGAFMLAGRGAPQPLTTEPVGFSQCGERISALQVVGDALWVGSFDRGLCRLGADQQVTRFAGPEYLPSDMINALASDGRSLYVATDAGLAIVDPAGRFSQHTHAQCKGQLDARCPWHAAVNGVAIEPDTGAAWVGDIGALHRIDPASGDWQHLGTRAVLGTQAVTRVAARRGELAIGTSDRGLLLRSGDGKRKRTRAIDDQAGLADNWITDLAYDRDGRLWIATCTRGVSVRERSGRFRHVGMREGLADDYVLSVQELDGRIWIGTLRGVSVIDGERVTNLSTADGLSGDEVHDAVIYAGAVWLATDGGLSVVEVNERVPSGGAKLLYSNAAR